MLYWWWPSSSCWKKSSFFFPFFLSLSFHKNVKPDISQLNIIIITKVSFPLTVFTKLHTCYIYYHTQVQKYLSFIYDVRKSHKFSRNKKKWRLRKKTYTSLLEGTKIPVFPFPSHLCVCLWMRSFFSCINRIHFFFCRYRVLYSSNIFIFLYFYFLLQLVGMLCISKQAGKARATFSCFLTNILRQQQKQRFYNVGSTKYIYTLFVVKVSVSLSSSPEWTVNSWTEKLFKKGNEPCAWLDRSIFIF